MFSTSSPQSRLFGLILLAVAGPFGCTSYEYDIVAPAELARHVGKEPTSFTQEPLEYRLQTVEDRLVVQIHNPTEEPIQLLGNKSVVVDPTGQSQPLRSQLIAPTSFTKLILPPMPARMEATGPSVGVGVGVGTVGYRGRRGYPYYGTAWSDPWYDEPSSYTVYDPNAGYWEWSGDGPVRLTLVFERDGKQFTQSFTIGRKEM